ncbi:MAG: hypothetical protein ACK4RW_10780 [Rehaibacterium terrae]|uniref:hypothetical protein n=1 Tax=Rehaibacterium terrae TaxID=1341696 RepID=UPI00391AF806
MRRTLALAAIAVLLAGCATYDGSYRERYVYRDGSYYYPYDDGRGDYYVGRHDGAASGYVRLHYGYGYDPFWWGGWWGPFHPYPYRSAYSFHYGYVRPPWFYGYSHGWPPYHYWPYWYWPYYGHAPRPPREHGPPRERRGGFHDVYRRAREAALREDEAEAGTPGTEWRERRRLADGEPGWRQHEERRRPDWREHGRQPDRRFPSAEGGEVDQRSTRPWPGREGEPLPWRERRRGDGAGWRDESQAPARRMPQTPPPAAATAVEPRRSGGFIRAAVPAARGAGREEAGRRAGVSEDEPR